MKITLLTYGSRGDVQPFLALALGLQQAGHQPTLAAPARFAAFIQQYNIPFAPLAGDPAELSQRFNDAGRNPIRMVSGMMQYALRVGAEMTYQTRAACRGAEFIVHTFAHVLDGHTLARELNIPDACLQLFPMFAPTGDYPNITLPNTGLRPLNRASHHFSSRFMEWGGIMGFEFIRRRAGLPSRRLYWPFRASPERLRTPLLCAWSPSVLPVSRDWPEYARVTGYVFMPGEASTDQPSSVLEEFLNSGPPPVCISFGSMLNRDAEKMYQVILQALGQAGQRAVLLTGWGSLPMDVHPGQFLQIDSAPHAWLLPRCKAVIHHGGAGTTAAGLRAGIPNIVIPHIADQPFWGQRVYDLGAGPRPLHLKTLTVDGLLAALAEAETQPVLAAAQAVGRSIRSEDGLGEVISAIEGHAGRWKASKP